MRHIFLLGEVLFGRGDFLDIAEYAVERGSRNTLPKRVLTSDQVQSTSDRDLTQYQ